MQCLDETRWCGVEDVDSVLGQLLVGVLDHLVHVLVVLTSVLEEVTRMLTIYLEASGVS